MERTIKNFYQHADRCWIALILASQCRNWRLQIKLTTNLRQSKPLNDQNKKQLDESIKLFSWRSRRDQGSRRVTTWAPSKFNSGPYYSSAARLYQTFGNGNLGHFLKRSVTSPDLTIKFVLPKSRQRMDGAFRESPQLLEQLFMTELCIPKIHGSGPQGQEFKSLHPRLQSTWLLSVRSTVQFFLPRSQTSQLAHRTSHEVRGEPNRKQTPYCSPHGLVALGIGYHKTEYFEFP